MKNAKRILSFFLIFSMLFSLMALSVTGASIDLAEIAANEDANLGQHYDVDDVVSLTEPESHFIQIPITGKSVDIVNAAISAGSVKLNLERNYSRPYLDSFLFPNVTAGGDISDTQIWQTMDKKPLFTNIEMKAVSDSENGDCILNVRFDSNCYFDSRGNVDYSAPHSNGGAYLDMCGWFTMNVVIGSYENNGSAELKITPYDSFHTMPEIYNEIDEIVELANANGLFAIKESMGFSSAGRDMPYMIIADSEESVTSWLELTEKAENDPTAILASIEEGELDNIRVPILYSNIHSNEVAAADGILRFAWALAESGIDGTFSYNELTGFTTKGEEQLESEMNDPSRCYGRGGKGVAVPDLIKDKATYLGYLQAGNGKSAAVDLDQYYTQQTNEISVKDLLSGVFYILVPEENVDGRTYVTRAASNGYDLNRDNSFQTTPETANMQRLIGTFNPVSFTELHGRVTNFQCEPCDPPHEPNFEYDLLAEHLITGGEAFGIAAVANNDSYNSYVMPQRDYLSYTDEEHTQTRWLSPWDDMSTSYTPQFAMLHGTVAYTVELPAYSEPVTKAVCYGIIGQSEYICKEKVEYLKDQVSIFERGVTNANSDAYDLVGQWFCDQYDEEGAEMDIFRPEYDGEGENGNFYPECYIIPLDGAVQKNIQAAVDMMVWLTRNDVLINITTEPVSCNGKLYPAGSVIISMYQAKRSVANGALYDGTLINNWPGLYSEGITSFNETRGFDMGIVTKPEEYAAIAKTLGENMDYEAALSFSHDFTSYFSGVKNADVILLNDSEDTVAAVNTLLQGNKKVAMVTGAEYYGNFICSYDDYLTIADDYLVNAYGLYGDEIDATLIQKAPTVYITGVPKPSTSGCIATNQVSNSTSWNYDRVAMEIMNFKVTENVDEADVFVGASAINGDALDAVLSGAPYIGYGDSVSKGNVVNAMNSDTSSLVRTELAGAMDCLAHVTYPNLSLVNASYLSNGDNVMYGYGFGFYSSIPEGAVALVAADNTQMPSEGFIPTLTESTNTTFNKFLDGGILGFSYKLNGLNVALFANTLTNKAHQRDEYNYISNFVFSAMLGDEEYTGQEAPVVALEKYSDVKDSDWFYGDVYKASERGLMNGTGSGLFSPKKGTTRGQIVTVLYRIKGQPTVTINNPFHDVKKGSYYEDAITWAYEFGIVLGKTSTRFAPDDPITREQMAAILYRYASVFAKDNPNCFKQNDQNDQSDNGLNDNDTKWNFSDISSISPYALEAVQWCVDLGLLNGVGNNKLAPKDGATRAQIAALLNRFVDLIY